MPLASTLSLLWIAGVCYYCPQTRRFISRQICRFTGQAEALNSPAAHSPVGSLADRYPANQHYCSCRGDQLIVRNGGDVYMPNGKKVHGVGENFECAICYCSLKESPDGTTAAVKVLECSHAFHSQCISDWYQHEKNCPTCRDTSTSLRNLRDFFFT